MPRRMEIRSKVCVVAKVYVISIETWSRRMENGLKVCVVAFINGGRYDYETMHVHHVIAKPGPSTSLRSPSGLWQSFKMVWLQISVADCHVASLLAITCGVAPGNDMWGKLCHDARKSDQNFASWLRCTSFL